MKRILFLALFVSLALSACAAKATPAPAASVAMERSAGNAAPDLMMEAPAASAPMADSAVDGGGQKTAYSNEPSPERMVIQNADLSIVVADPGSKMEAIAAMAEKMGGWVVSSNQYQTYAQSGKPVPQGSITVRVPAEKLDDALAAIKKDTVDVTSENRSGQDVTKDYIDLKSRLKNLEAAEQELTRIMQEADKTEDVLSTFDQLTYYREQIEVVKGQMQYYEESVALSAITVQVVAEETIQPIEIGGWKPQGVARDAFQALIDFGKGFLSFLIWLVILIIPAGLVILVMLWGVWRVFRFAWRRLFPRKKNVSPQQPVDPARNNGAK